MNNSLEPFGMIPDPKFWLLTAIVWIGFLAILALTGCTMKLVRTEDINFIDRERYQILESYKQGLKDMMELYDAEAENEKLIPYQENQVW